MASGPIGGPRPLVSMDGTGPLGLERPLAKTVEDCMESSEAQKFVDNLEEQRGEPFDLERKQELKRAWCEGVVGEGWLRDWLEGLETAGVAVPDVDEFIERFD